MNTDRYRDLLLDERERVSASIQHLHEEGSLEEETEEETYDDNHLADSATAVLASGRGGSMMPTRPR